MLLRAGYCVSLILDISESEFRTWDNHLSKPFPTNGGRLTNYHVAALCADIDLSRESFPSDAHWNSYKFAWCVKKIHQIEHIDLIEFFDYCGAAYYTLLQRPGHPDSYPARVAIRLHNTIEVIARRTGAEFEDYRLADFALERASLAMADLVLPSGQGLFDQEIASLYSIDPSRVQISPPVCTTDDPVPRSEDARDVLFVGRISTFKGLDRFLHAAVAILADPASSALVGDFIVIGPEETVSSAQSERNILAIADEWLGGRIKLAGRLDHAGIRRHFATACCAVFANRMESFCYAAHEAHIAGVPLVLSDTPTFRDFFVHEESALFFDGSIPDLVAGLCRLATDAGLRRRLSDSRAKTIARYDEDHYRRHLSIAPFAPPAEPTTGHEISIVFLHRVAEIHGGGAKLSPDYQLLKDALPAAHHLHLRPATKGARVQLFGDFYRAETGDGEPLIVQRERLRDRVVFVDPERLPSARFLKNAIAALSAMPMIGAICPGQATAEGALSISTIPIGTIDPSAASVSLIGAVCRVQPGQTLVEIAADPGPTTEMAYLQTLRQRGGVIADWPDRCFDAFVHPPMMIAGPSWPRFLRRNAWSLDRVVMATQLPGGRPPIAVREVTPGDVVSTRMARLLHESIEHPDCVYVVPNGLRASGNAWEWGYVTLVRIFPGPSAATLRWGDCTFQGPWETYLVADEAAGLRRAKAGVCTIYGFSHGRINFLAGPDQDEAVLIWQGKAVLFDLKRRDYADVVVEVEPLFADFAGRRWVEDGRAAAAIPDLTALAGRSHLAPIIVAASAGRAAYARAIGAADPGDHPVIQIEPRLGSKTAAVLLGSHAKASAIETYQFLNGAENRRIIETLLDHYGDLSCALIVPAGIGWQKGGFSDFRAVVRLKRRFGSRLTIKTAGEGLTSMFAAEGVATTPVRARPLAPEKPARAGGAVDLVLAGGSGEIPSFGHVAAALMLLPRSTLTRVGDIVVCSPDPQLEALLKRFGLHHRVHYNEQTHVALSAREGRRFVYIAPFADGLADPYAYLTLEKGGLILVAPDSVSLEGFSYREQLEITYWEQSDQIASQMTAIIEDYGTIAEAFRKWGAAASGPPN